MRPGMTFLQYVKDRLTIICSCLIAIALSLVVVWLDLGIGQRYVNSESLVYIFILGAIVMMAGLVYDYTNQRRWYKEIYNAESNMSDSDFTLCLQHPVTREQKRMHSLVTRQYRSFMNELLSLRQDREQHVHFTNQWVHHMKTPLSVIHLLTQQPSHDLTSTETEQLLSSISEEGDRLTRGLDMMLHTARLDKFELDLHVSGLHLQNVIRQVINQNKKALIRYQIYPKVTPGDVIVESDEKWLSFILTQLVTNAIKYSKDKPGNKSLQFLVEEANGVVRLQVEDEGVGIAEQDIPRVFEPFFTGENGRKEGDATGMGLYLVGKVCARLGHNVSIASKLNEGTAVTLLFSTTALHHDLIQRS
ncbi:sensor histidine kinase [Paenibacillus sp. MER TA 81-3]|uniref:sensor histidine kinase n=1 Tax=Paenibacillus sp. MER TA 81-3 TaxID=2939573 RepID=UPI00203C5544|nr:sensor histidine kinase [Paenibacillus sp. MER TA 81-3]